MRLFLQLICISILAEAKLINLKGRLLRVAVPSKDALPLFSITYNSNGTVTCNGAEIELLKYIAGVLNFTFVTVPSVDGNFGAFVNGSWNGMIGMLQRKEADIALGTITITYTRSTVVDFSWPIMDSPLCMVSHIPGPLPKWQAVLWPFQLDVWIAILASCPLFGIFFWFVVSKVAGQHNYTLMEALTFSFASLLAQGDKEWPRVPFLQLVLLFWILYCFIVDVTFSSSLTSYLTLQRLSKPLETLEELADSNYYEIRVQSGTITQYLFQNSTDPMFKRLAAKLDSQKEKYANGIDGYYMNMKNNKLVLFRDCVKAKAETSLYLSLKSGQTYEHISKETIAMGGYGQAIVKGAPYLEDYNRLVRRAIYFGLLDTWIKISMRSGQADILAEEAAKKPVRLAVESYITALPSNQGSDIKVLSLNDLQGPFYIILVSIGLSCLSFIVELFIHQHQKRRSKTIGVNVRTINVKEVKSLH